MEGGVEDADVGHAGQCALHGLDAGDVGRVVQRGQRDVFAQGVEHGVGDQHRTRELLGAMHHAVADGGDVLQRLDDADVGVDQLLEHLLDRDLVIGDVGNFLDLVAVGGFIGKDRILHADALDEADGHASLVAHVEQLVFERGTAAVQNKNEHVFLFPLKVLPMPRWAFVAG